MGENNNLNPSTDTVKIREQIKEKKKKIEVLQTQTLNRNDLSKEKQLIIEELITSEVIIKEVSEKLLNKNDTNTN